GVLRGAQDMTTAPVPDSVDSPLGVGEAMGGAARAGAGKRYRGTENLSSGQKAVIYALLVAGGLLMLVPFVFLVSASLKAGAEGNAGALKLVPERAQWSNYPRALAEMGFYPALANTVVITVCCVAGQILSCSLVGFGFARFKFRGRSVL